MSKITEILKDIISFRRSSPGSDAISMLMKATVDNRKVSDDELLNMGLFLFFAGTDSTANAISYALSFLAQQERLRHEVVNRIDDEKYIKNVSEELLRLHGFHHLTRRVAKDICIKGVQLKEGDMVVLSTGGANRDIKKYRQPNRANFSRVDARTHLTFGAGIHRCSGSQLATLQLRIALQEFHRTFPNYRLARPVKYIAGGGKAAPSEVILYTR